MSRENAIKGEKLIQLHLSLISNKLKSLPENIGKLQGLQRLEICDNQLIHLPESIVDLKNLKTLYIADNPELTITPAQKGWMKNISVLDMDLNKVKATSKIIHPLQFADKHLSFKFTETIPGNKRSRNR